MNPVKIPYAVSNYEEAIRDSYYLVDKTDYLPELEKYKVPVFLRPRRFGKTLLCSMLECYYDINHKDQFDELFGHTLIAHHPTPERNSCLVMRFNFSKIQITDDIKYIEENFISECHGVYKSFLINYHSYFENFELEKGNSSKSLSTILKFISDLHLPPAYIIIDEYDNFTNQLIQSHQDGLYQDLTTSDSFFRTFFKVIKAGTEDLSVRRCYITGVLPITIDDLTSGFNIAEILTLEPHFISMLGFTQTEVDAYLKRVFDDYGFETSQLEFIRKLMKSYYNGYRFGINSPELYNSTIITFFLKKFVLGNGEIPQDFIDDNIKTDTSWIRRLTGSEKSARAVLEKLMIEGGLEYDYNMISSTFTMNQFFEESFYPVSLFYLGMLTIQDQYRMCLPNQTLKKIMTGYFNELERINVSIGYTSYFRTFKQDMDISKLFAGYFKTYIGQIPAQACDKINENFYRTTFYELCTRYLSMDFVFTIETNYPSGRSDWEMLGKYHTHYKNQKWVIEFKHFSKDEAKKKRIYDLESAREEDRTQVEGYAQDIVREFPEYKIRKYVIYTISCETFRCFEV